VAFRLEAPAAAFFVVVSAFDFVAAALDFSSAGAGAAGFSSVSGFVLVTLGDAVFFGFAAAAAFFAVVLVFAMEALAAAVDDFVDSRGDRRNGPVVEAFLGGIISGGYVGKRPPGCD
jgi:hypothetical protein